MSSPGSWLLSVPLLAALLLAGWAILAVSQAVASTFSLLIYVLANVMVFMDFLDFGLRLYLCRANAAVHNSDERPETSVPLDTQDLTTEQKRIHVRPYALVVSVFNAEEHLEDFMEAMRPYRGRLWVIDDGSTDNTRIRLRQAGWRCVDGQINRKKPGAIRVLLDNLPPEIETVMVIDPDISIRSRGTSELDHLEEIVVEFQRSRMAAVCPRIAIKEDGLLARFQSLEYCMVSLGRRSLADHSTTSGVALYRRQALESVLKQHSLSVYAEDLENTVILLGGGDRVYYDGRLVVETEGKSQWRHWFSQRVGWFYGLIKVYFEHFPDIRRAGGRGFMAAYQYLVYMGIVCLLLHPLKLVGLALLLLSLANGLDGLLGLDIVPDSSVTHPVYFLAACAKYLLLCLVAFCTVVPRRERLYVLPVVPLYFFYALAHLLPVSVGYANWFALKIRRRRLFRDHYQDDEALLRQPGDLVHQKGEA